MDDRLLTDIGGKLKENRDMGWMRVGGGGGLHTQLQHCWTHRGLIKMWQPPRQHGLCRAAAPQCLHINARVWCAFVEQDY